MLKIYNSLGKKAEDFRPLNAPHVTMYVCGPTVYSYLHVGNFRGPVFFNFVRNWLEHSGYQVKYALNFTDVDDKIINRATEEKKTPQEVSEFYIKEYKKDFTDLELKPHDYNPKVSDHMNDIIQMIEKLIENKKAYVTDSKLGSDVNYSIENFKDYGKLSGRKVEDLKVGVRIDADEKKQSPLDFALWKAAKAHEGSAGSAWKSPWGHGRPGWHIECSAMVKSLFGDQIDIHGGGLDLIFPHHENEIAQSEGCTGHDFVKTWMHVNMLNFGGSKMSKSLGNVVTMRDFLKNHHAEIYKWMILSVHYRSLADFSDAAIDLAIAGLSRVYSALALADSLVLTNEAFVVDNTYKAELDQAWAKITEHINDDFSTPQAVAVVFEQIRKFNSQFKRGMKSNASISSKAQMFLQFVSQLGAVMSLFNQPAEKFLKELDLKLLEKMNVKSQDIDLLVAERSKARDNKDYAKSDEIRKKLTDLKIAVSDTPSGSYWEVSK